MNVMNAFPAKNRISESDSVVNETDVEYLLKQYPWFSKEEILEAVHFVGDRKNRIMAYLDMKSGNWSFLDLYEY